MANIPKGLLAGSDPKIMVGSYGPTLEVREADDGAIRLVLPGTVGVPDIDIASWDDATGAFTVAVATLNPAVVPYANAFVRSHGTVEKYWRTGLYSFRPIAGVTVAETVPGTWSVSGHPAPVATTNAAVVAKQPSTAKARATGKAPASSAPAPVVFVPVAPVPATETVVPVKPKRGVKGKAKPGEIIAPKGWVALTGRDGDTLVVPERTLVTFAAAVGARFEDSRPAHVLVVGPAGTGKTESVIALAMLHGMGIAGVVQCGGIEGPSDLYGQTAPDETAAHGWRRMPSILWSAFATARDNPDRRYLVLLDEVNRVGTASAQNALLGALDGTASLANPATGEAIPLPSNLMVAATANIGVAYSGTVRMDAALMSRWWTNLSFGYLPESVESVIATAIIGDADQGRYLSKAAAALRAAHAVDEFRSALIPGTREIVAVAWQAKRDPEGAAGAWHDKITSSFSNEGRDPSRTEYARVRIISEGVFKAPIQPDERAPEDMPF